MKNLKTIIGLAAMALCLGFASCSSDDDAPSYSTAAVSNSELMTILKDKGYQFNEQGNLLLDDKATSTTSLDLSGTKISQKALAELNILPNLTDVNLSNNGYGPVFHVDSLPAQIKGLDLQGNEIYDFEGLVDAKVVNDEVVATVLHPFNKLYLPTSCKYNVEDLMPFYTANNGEGRATANTIDMKMVNDKGTLEAYNTLREIPDEYFRAYLKSKFQSLFTDETHIDISKPMSATEQGEPIHLWFQNNFADIDKIKSIEGVEYFINNPYIHEFYVSIGYETPFNLNYIMPRNNVKGLQFTHISTPSGFDLSKATNLSTITLSNDKYLKNIDLSQTKVGNQNLDDIDATVGNLLECVNDENLESIILPSNPVGIINTLYLENLPLLKELNISGINAVTSLILLNISKCNISFPELKYVYNSGKGTLEEIPATKRKAVLVVSEDVFNKESTKSFISKYKNNLRDRYSQYEENGAYAWSEKL